MGRNRFVAVNVGPTGSGKTTVTIEKILPSASRPVYIVDPQHEYDLKDSIVFDGSQDDQRNPVRELLVYMDGVARGEFPQKQYLIIRTAKQNRELAAAQGRDLFRRIATGRWPGTLVVDETPRWCSASKCYQALHDCIIEGGHFGGEEKGLSLVFAARRLAYLGKDITSNAHITILFRQSESNDINRAGMIGFDKDKVRNLSGHEYLSLTKRDVPFSGDLSPAH